jgi:hypothetical protein
MEAAVTTQLTDSAKLEIIHHCNAVWPLISLVPPEPMAIAQANTYLDQLEAADYPMYDVVMQMLAKAKGLSWRQLKDNM